MKCYLCGARATAKLNGTHYVCSKHALEFAAESLKQGGLVLMANRGEPKYLIVPGPVKVGAGAQSLN
jgi:hypothetical protein